MECDLLSKLEKIRKNIIVNGKERQMQKKLKKVKLIQDIQVISESEINKLFLDGSSKTMAGIQKSIFRLFRHSRKEKDQKASSDLYSLVRTRSQD
jgi:hypothetical protein